jgi:hypothetical protein
MRGEGRITGIRLALPRQAGVYRLGFAGFCWGLSRLTAGCRRVFGAGVGWGSLGFTAVCWGCWGLLGFAGVCWGLLGFIAVDWGSPRSTGLDWFSWDSLRFSGDDCKWSASCWRFTGVHWGCLGFAGFTVVRLWFG